MLSRRRWLRGALAAALCGGGVAAWRLARRSAALLPGASDVPETRDAHVLRRGNGAEPESLDLHAARSEPALTLLRDLYEGLMEVGADGTPQLAAAGHCEVSADGCEYRFELRAGSRWSSGEPVTAADFVAAWRRLVDPRTGAQYSNLLRAVRGAAAIAGGTSPPAALGVDATDAATLRVRLEHPLPYFPSVLTHPATFPLHRPSLAALGRGFAKPGRLVSNGAFRVTRWDFGSHLVAARNEHYWDAARCAFERSEYYSFADGAAELRAYRAGELDVTNSIPAALFAPLRAELGAELHVAPQLAVYYLGFNMRRSPLGTSAALRRALSMVVDRERLVASITGAGETPAYAWVPPYTQGYTPVLPEYAAWPLERRIDAARRLVDAAGLSGKIPTVEIRYNSSELHARIAVAVASMWKTALGIDTALRAEEYKALMQDIQSGESTQLFRGSWVADYDDPQSFLQVLEGGSSINLPRYANPRYDTLLADAARAQGAERESLLGQAERLMLDDQPLIPLYFYVAKHLVAPRVRGWRSNAMNVVYAKNLSKAPASPAAPTDASGNLRGHSLTSALS